MSQTFDAVIIGSGFGGSMIAHQLAQAGWKIGMIERGERVQRGAHNWSKTGSIDLTKNYDKNLPYEVLKGGNKKQMGVYSAVGGPSIFYGGVSFRFREADFHPPAEIIGDSGAQWPITYHNLEPYYNQAESLLQIAGEAGIDPTEPPRNNPFPQRPVPYAGITKRVKKAAESLGLNPFHLPLAINYQDPSRNTCQLCTTCDTFACAIQAKNDLETMLINKQQSGQFTLLENTVVHRIEVKNGGVKQVLAFDKITNQPVKIAAKVCILSAGALASPHILLNSGLEDLNPAGSIIGRYLMRHVNAIIFGIFPGIADKETRFHKELAILDYYFGHADAPQFSKIGSLQQVSTPPGGLVEHEAPLGLGKFASKAVKLLTGLLAIAEDQPQYQNYVGIDRQKKGKYNMAVPVVSHEYTARDLAALKVLVNGAKKVMKKSGALVNYVHHIRTFSHSCGTIRMGDDPKTAPLDRYCNFRGVDNLYVVDGCFMPTAAAVNPSLTISANALRVGDFLTDKYQIA